MLVLQVSNALRTLSRPQAMAPIALKRGHTTDRDISPPPSKRKVAATATNKAVTNFFKPTSQKEQDVITFSVLHETLLVARHGEKNDHARSKPAKIAAFDFDDTLVTTSSGNRFARDQNDWRWWDVSVPGRLKKLHEDGYTLVVLSNQGGISLKPHPKTIKGDMKALNTFKGKVTSVLTALDLPLTVYAATGKDLYRKPRTGMWEQMLRDHGLSDTNDIAREDCVFVGDAAGRAGDKAKGLRNDHACSDRDMAANVDIPFQTPEEYFLQHEAAPFARPFNPALFLVAETPNQPVFEKRNEIDIVLFCGSPGAGKSTFYWTVLEPLGYGRVNQDILKTRDRCVREARALLQAGSSVVVDNTNAEIETRAVWIKLAHEFKIPIRLVHFTSPAKLCEHNDTVRALSQERQMNPENRTMLPKMAFTSFTSRYRPPQLTEGFQDVVQVDFQFRGTAEQKAIWKRYWVS